MPRSKLNRCQKQDKKSQIRANMSFIGHFGLEQDRYEVIMKEKRERIDFVLACDGEIFHAL
jgi:hypothetical protein